MLLPTASSPTASQSDRMTSKLPPHVQLALDRGELCPSLLAQYDFKNNKKATPKPIAKNSFTKKEKRKANRAKRIRSIYRSHVGHKDPLKFPACPECKLALANRTERDTYYKEVWEITEASFKKHYNQINPTGVNRGSDWHLDHKFSIAEGFRSGLPASLIGSHHNLQMLPSKDNIKKGDSCSISESELQSLAGTP